MNAAAALHSYGRWAPPQRGHHAAVAASSAKLLLNGAPPTPPPPLKDRTRSAGPARATCGCMRAGRARAHTHTHTHTHTQPRHSGRSKGRRPGSAHDSDPAGRAGRPKRPVPTGVGRARPAAAGAPPSRTRRCGRGHTPVHERGGGGGGIGKVSSRSGTPRRNRQPPVEVSRAARAETGGGRRAGSGARLGSGGGAECRTEAAPGPARVRVAVRVGANGPRRSAARADRGTAWPAQRCAMGRFSLVKWAAAGLWGRLV